MFPGITSKLTMFTQILVSEFVGGVIKKPNRNVPLRAEEYVPSLALIKILTII